MDIRDKALAFAAEKHKGQTYDNSPYIVHPIEVANIVIQTHHAHQILLIEAEVVALLHDILEDTDVAYDELRAEFGDAVASAIAILTRSKWGETYREYIQQIAESNNLTAIAVKKADLECNLKHSSWFGAKKASSLIKRWAWALTELNKES